MSVDMKMKKFGCRVCLIRELNVRINDETEIRSTDDIIAKR